MDEVRFHALECSSFLDLQVNMYRRFGMIKQCRPV